MNKTAWRPIPVVVSAILTALLTVPAASAATVTETDVSPTAAHFPQNKQNESPMVVNPTDANNAISGANDEIQEPDCTPPTGGSSSCPFSPTTQTTGVYVTKNAGQSWSQAILNWSSANLRSDGDPVVAFGPKPNGSGGFTYANGARAYFGSLAGVLGASFASPQEFIAVAQSNDGGTTWSAPVVATSRTNPVDFNDKIAIWVDNNPISPNFGFVYVSWTLFKGVGNFGESKTFSPEPIMFTRSTDGGQTFENAQQLTQAANNGSVGGRQGSTIRSAPHGDVFVFWDGALNHVSAILAARSINGGVSFTRPFLVSFKSDVPSPFPGASFRTNSFPMAAIDASGNLFVAWTDSTNGHAVVKLAKSADRGASWSVSTAADVTGRSAFYPGVAVSASNIFIGFTAIDDQPADTAPGAGAVFYDSYYVLSTNSGASFGTPVKISAISSDPDASTTNGLRSQFLGDYNGAASSPDGSFWFSWTDTRNGATCDAIDAWRASGFTTPKPNIYDLCSPDFGNSDIFVAHVTP